jgi:hypothetical protein
MSPGPQGSLVYSNIWNIDIYHLGDKYIQTNNIYKYTLRQNIFVIYIKSTNCIASNWITLIDLLLILKKEAIYKIEM